MIVITQAALRLAWIEHEHREYRKQIAKAQLKLLERLD
jgi:hypothetical protein